MNEEINLGTLFNSVARTIKKHRFFVIGLFALGVTTSFVLLKFVSTPTYSAQCVIKSTYLNAKNIEMSLEHINAVLASKKLNKNYAPYQGCLTFAVKSEEIINSEDEFLSQKNTFATIKVETKNKEQLPYLANSLKSYFDTNSTFVNVRNTKHLVLKKMVEELNELNSSTTMALEQAPENAHSDLLLLPTSHKQIAMAEAILSTTDIVSIVDQFSPPEEKSKKTLPISILIGVSFVGIGFLIKSFVEA